MKNTNKVQTKFFHQNSTKSRTIHFNIPAAVKHGRDSNNFLYDAKNIHRATITLF